MDIILITPPTFADRGPLLMACPALMGFLEVQEIEAIHLDLNIEFPRFLNNFLATDNEAGSESLPDRLGAASLRWWLTKRPKAAHYEFGERAASNQSELLTPPPETYHHLICTKYPVFLELLYDKTHNPYYRYFDTYALPQILETKPLILAVSIVSPTQLLSTLTLTTMVRKNAPEVFIVLGGPFITAYVDEFRRSEELFPLWHGLIVEEGETPLAVLTRILKRKNVKSELDRVPNLFFQRDNVIECSSIHSTEDLNSLPTPKYTTLYNEKGVQPPFLIQASRQCYWKQCKFCVHVSSTHQRYRHRNAARVVDDIMKLHDTIGAADFFFADLSVSPSQLRAISAEVLDRCTFTPNLTAFTRFEKALTPALLNQCASAGFKRFYFGLETVNRRLSELMRKGHSGLDQITNTLEVCQSLGIESTVHTIFGFPTEMESETLETYRYLLERRHLCEPIVEVFRIEKGTPIFNQPRNFEIEIIHDADHERFNNACRFRQLRPDAITTRRAQELRSQFYLEYWGEADEAKPLDIMSVLRLKEGVRLIKAVFNYDDADPAAELRLPLIVRGNAFQPVIDVIFEFLKCIDGHSSISAILNKKFEVAEEEKSMLLRILSALSEYFVW